MGDTVIPPVDLAASPPMAAAERHTLVTFLDYFRSVLLRKASGLTPEQLATRLGPSTLTIGGIVKHMAVVEDGWFQEVWLDAEMPEPWASVDWEHHPDWEFDTAGDDSPTDLLQLFTAAVDRSRAAVETCDDLDLLAARELSSGPTSMRWILVHMIEEYARHCGHADLIRESLDGSTGD
ncbi:MAG: DinB family protein [Ilumatobacter sp.]|uniref:DinB family protein n=1 Tax=Ilumatobacter sp. TaxID=1967498 RepID=UPI00261BEB65|nr:DinB family protein [Ilumatobacter sp.]MDJ0768074.1 DinB family protein [Ilumatobacter sp.]